MKNIIAIGEILWDIFPDKKLLGGAPANFIYHSMKIGCNAYIISAIGKDNLGIETKQKLAEKKIFTLLTENNYPTGNVHITTDEKGVASYTFPKECAWDFIKADKDEYDAIADADAICFGSLAQRNNFSRTTILSLLKKAPANSLKIFDINLRQNFYSKEIIEDSMLLCNILKINEDEKKIISRMFSSKEYDNNSFAQKIFEKYPHFKFLILTLGGNGSCIYSKDEYSFIPANDIIIADTVGAGDSFTATFIASILKGETLQIAHKKAAEISEYVCQQYGAMPEIPERFKIFE